MEKYLQELSKRFNPYSYIVHVDYIDCIDELFIDLSAKEINEYWYVFWHPEIKPTQLQGPFIILDEYRKPLPIFLEDTLHMLVPYLKKNYKWFIR
ncbi:hypothetical protein JNUCC1_03374 [Lentibacillus sp. JNUCC-1]|uniref:hypothetical protein n=1 Tax=Lentibacillus sp. JNUCC-1 TaxID=2654513 RepID=UPI0012E7ADAC|nr:hypothetical protein [Lentibacillus sp. JNUCC-1]MUV39496.1 hypothetical protein [Lentibacillus sp. JNUCC-1]